jgi:hypothetical protein
MLANWRARLVLGSLLTVSACARPAPPTPAAAVEKGTVTSDHYCPWSAKVIAITP